MSCNIPFEEWECQDCPKKEARNISVGNEVTNE